MLQVSLAYQALATCSELLAHLLGVGQQPESKLPQLPLDLLLQFPRDQSLVIVWLHVKGTCSFLEITHTIVIIVIGGSKRQVWVLAVFRVPIFPHRFQFLLVFFCIPSTFPFKLLTLLTYDDLTLTTQCRDTSLTDFSTRNDSLVMFNSWSKALYPYHL